MDLTFGDYGAVRIATRWQELRRIARHEGFHAGYRDFCAGIWRDHADRKRVWQLRYEEGRFFAALARTRGSETPWQSRQTVPEPLRALLLLGARERRQGRCLF